MPSSPSPWCKRLMMDIDHGACKTLWIAHTYDMRHVLRGQLAIL